MMAIFYFCSKEQHYIIEGEHIKLEAEGTTLLGVWQDQKLNDDIRSVWIVPGMWRDQ